MQKTQIHKPLLCYNKHGPRCDPGLLKETDCYFQEAHHGRCCDWTGGRPGENECIPYKLKTNRELSERECPYPCGCIFSGEPQRDTKDVFEVKKIPVSDGMIDRYVRSILLFFFQIIIKYRRLTTLPTAETINYNHLYNIKI